MFSQTITLFNRREGERGDEWIPTVIKNVMVNLDRASIIAKYGAQSNDNATVHIPYKRSGNDIVISDKLWVPPKMWERMDGYIEAVTFTPGDRFDFFWVGEWTENVPLYDVDYAAEGDFYTYMNRKRDHVFAITSVSGPYGLIPHFEVFGK